MKTNFVSPSVAAPSGGPASVSANALQPTTPPRLYVDRPYGEPGTWLADRASTALVAKVYPDYERHAEELVRAVNMHEEFTDLARTLAALPVHSPEWLENPSVRVDLLRAVCEARRIMGGAAR